MNRPTPITTAEASDGGKLGVALGWIARVENALLALMMLALVVVSCVQIGRRLVFNDGWIDSDTFGRNLVLWIAVMGALAATRERRHVSIDLFGGLPPNRWRSRLHHVSDVGAAIGCGFLAWFGWGLVVLEWESGTQLMPLLPSWLAAAVIPLGFGLMAVRFSLLALGRRPEFSMVETDH